MCKWWWACSLQLCCMQNWIAWCSCLFSCKQLFLADPLTGLTSTDSVSLACLSCSIHKTMINMTIIRTSETLIRADSYWLWLCTPNHVVLGHSLWFTDTIVVQKLVVGSRHILAHRCSQSTQVFQWMLVYQYFANCGSQTTVVCKRYQLLLTSAGYGSQ